MTVALVVLRVVCGAAALFGGGVILFWFIRDALHRSATFTLGAAFFLALFAASLIGSGLFTIAGVWR